MSALIDNYQMVEEMSEASCWFDFGHDDMLRLSVEGLNDVWCKAVRDVLDGVEDGFRYCLCGQGGDEGNHLLIHDPVTFFDPRCDLFVGKQLLDWYGESSIECGVMAEEHSFLAEA